ncbi:TIGR00730 family Rossman fold protein [Mechercharimyces sp. CAU 1602]|uniref:LOG family protein n=1 Tax=Mechercharimyces sp. CAU 1602 TaxID=2973933 RepID=UPI00216223E8|nr:TIGR00730 family Rossman fold protein [Mechercharimyces sp. CAU 1602]MCS1350458.1 TIGR00730 family Rossman fold protein [Mechercharimyces sp. CAU 1602]
MKRICIFAGSNVGTRQEYQEAAVQLSKELVEYEMDVVFGGSSIGLMGVMANTILDNGGKVVGVIPKNLFRGEMVHTQLTQLFQVKTMHERKAKMGELSDAFIALPGGFGTLEEIFEVVSWGQLGIHQKPIGLYNVAGYYDPLLQLVERGIEDEFIPEEHRDLLICESDPARLIEKIKSSQPPGETDKWKEIPSS